jgi:hypothetical protein
MMVCSQAMAMYVHAVVGMAKDGKMVFNAQMVRRGPTMARIRTMMNITIAVFIVSSSTLAPSRTDH